MIVDPQFGIVRVLRPYQGFEAIYQGHPATGSTAVPIMLSEAGIELDEEARNKVTGYDPELVRGLPVPLGARVVLWVPFISAILLEVGASPYVYMPIWRFRNTADYRRNKTPYHYPKQIEGVPETMTNPGPRVVIPAAINSVIYNQTEVATGFIQTQKSHGESVAFGGATIEPPLNSSGALGVIQQGVQASLALGRHTRPEFYPWEIQAEGDELLIAVTRFDDFGGTEPNWDLSHAPAGVDALFSTFYGTGAIPGGGTVGARYPDLGLYVTVGTSP